MFEEFLSNFQKISDTIRTVGLDCLTNQGEQAMLYRLACAMVGRASRGATGSFVELGTGSGSSAMIIAQALIDRFSGQKVVSVDNYAQTSWGYGQVCENLERCGMGKHVELINSDDLEYLGGLDDRSVLFIYLDSLHTYEHIRKTLNLCLAKGSQSSLICIHDYWPETPGVVQAVEEFWDEYRDLLLGRSISDRLCWIMKK